MGAAQRFAHMRLTCIFAALGFTIATCVRDGGDIATAPAGDLSPVGTDEGLTELAWIAPNADKVRILMESPGECLRGPADDEEAYRVEVGRAAFESPFLFGGEAARGGLSCSSCHRNGHGNDAFFLKGLSAAPGTADVTSSLFSKTREDGVFNPVPIPSLVGVAGKDAFGTRAPAPSLHAFIESAVTQEFQGAPPPKPVLEGLSAYVAHLDPAACPDGVEPRTARGDMAGVRRALSAAHDAVRRKDFDTADFLLVSAQNALGRIHERYAASDLKPQRAALEALSAKLAAIRPVLSEDANGAAQRIGKSLRTAEALGDDLHAHRRRSLYDLETLAAALGE